LLTAPTAAISCHIAASRSPACQEGSITAERSREYVAVITSTGRIADWPCPTGIGVSGNHRSHWVAWPGSWTSRSAGSTPAYSGRIARTRSLRIVIEWVQPIRSAITVAGIRGNACSSARICGSTASTNEPLGARS
jgi:hypothetical protein